MKILSLQKWANHWLHFRQEEQIRLGQKKSQHRPEKIICENKTKMKLC